MTVVQYACLKTYEGCSKSNEIGFTTPFIFLVKPKQQALPFKIMSSSISVGRSPFLRFREEEKVTWDKIWGVRRMSHNFKAQLQQTLLTDTAGVWGGASVAPAEPAGTV